jgi:glycosyltransferase involved in cell wall biosynthesis
LKQIKILFVHNRYKQYGGEDSVLESERTLLERYDHPTDLFLYDNREIERLPHKVRTVLEVNYSKKTKLQLFQKIINSTPDIVHVHNFFPLLTPSVYDACHESGLPVVQTLHNYRTICPGAMLMAHGKICELCIKGSPYHAVFHRCYRNSFFGSFVVARMVAYHRRNNTWNNKVNKFIALTEFSKRKFVAAGFSTDKISVKPNFYDQKDKPTSSDIKRNGALFVGRLSSEKGISTLLHAWKMLDIPLLIAGDGPMMKDVRHDPSSQVSILGRVSQGQVSTIMSNAAFLVMPSEWYEGFPMVLVEAFAHGLPVVASRLGSMAEIVVDGETGIHCEPGNPRALAEKARWMFEHPEECRRMGENARKAYEDKYTPEKNYQLLINIYRETIEEYKHGRA